MQYSRAHTCLLLAIVALLVKFVKQAVELLKVFINVADMPWRDLALKWAYT